jgi:signal recognition particle receptor subunit beta
MVVLNYTGEEINAKIVYYGPGLSGKTTNLEYLYGQMPADSKGQMVSMKTRTDRTLFFDFFPLELGEINGYRARFLLYTVPGQVYYNATRKLVLKGADAVVFVADSARDKLQESIESLRNLEDNLNEHGLSLDDIPWVIQYNKRDLEDPLPVAELHQHLNLMNVPAYEAIAMTGVGVYDTFKGIAGILFRQLKERLESGEAIPAATADASDPAGQPGAGSPANVEEAVDSALREIGPAPASPITSPPPTPPAAPRNQAEAAPGPDPIQHVAPVPAPPVQEKPPAEAPAQPRQPALPPPVQPQVRPTPVAEAAPAVDVASAVEEPPEPAPNANTFSLGSEAEASSPDVGRLVELDESSEPPEVAQEEPPEFITDPMRTGSTTEEEPAEIEPEEGPVVADRNADVQDHEVVVPVLISRSQVSKTLSLKLRLEIRVIDD